MFTGKIILCYNSQFGSSVLPWPHLIMVSLFENQVDYLLSAAINKTNTLCEFQTVSIYTVNLEEAITVLLWQLIQSQGRIMFETVLQNKYI